MSSTLCALALSPLWLLGASLAVLVGCGSYEPVSLAERVKQDFVGGQMGDAYDLMTEELRNKMELARLKGLRQYDDADKAGREALLKQINDEHWWDKTWVKLKDRPDLERLTTRQIYQTDMAERNATAKDFAKRAAALKRVGYSRAFRSNAQWGEAQVTYSNALDDEVEVFMEQREGTWYVNGIQVRGFTVRPKEQVEME